MKKFFKALALVLALVLVIGAIPASAATSFSMKKDVKRVYLGGAQGKKADGTQCKTSSKYRISKLINGFDAATMYLKLESSDKTIVKTNNAKRKVYGKKIGSATVKISVYDKETDILLDGTLSATIEVKKNADPTTVIPIVTDVNGAPVDPTAKYALNTPYTVIISRKDAAGNLIDTDKRSIVCTSDNKDYVEIKAANDYTTKYTVTFKKAGDYTFAISNYQSKTWDAPITTFPFTVTAGYTVKDVKQVALDKVVFTFETEVSNLVAENFNTYFEVKDATGKISKVYPTAVKDVVIDPTDKTKATLIFLSDFVGGETYYFEYGDSTVKEDVTYENEDGEDVRFFIKAATINADSAYQIIIPEQTVTAGKTTEITYQVIDESGLDITSFIKEQADKLNGEFSFELVNGDFYAYISEGNTSTPKIFITEPQKTYTVKASYSWWSNNAGKMLTAPGSGVVVSIAEAVSKRDASKFEGRISQSDKLIIKEDGTLNSDVTTLSPWAVGDAGVYLQAAIGYVNESTKKVTYENLGTTNGLEFKNYYVKSSNDNIVMVSTKPGDYATEKGKIELVANQPGSAWLVVYGQNDNKADVAVGSIMVNVVAARKASKITVTASKKDINAANANDKIEFEVKLFDQYEKSGTIAGNVKLELYKGKDVTLKTVKYGAAGDKIPVSGSDFTAVAANNVVLLKFTLLDANGNATQITETVQINVGNETAPAKQVLVVDKDTFDTAVKFDSSKANNVKVANIYLEGKTASGYAVTGADIKFISKAPVLRPDDGSAFDEFVYTVTRDNVAVESQDGKNFVGNTFKNIYTTDDASPVAVKLKAGTYEITAYRQAREKAADGTWNIVVSRLNATKLIVTENRPAYSITITANAEKLDSFSNADIQKAFKVVYDNKDVTATCDFTTGGFKINGETKSAFVEKVVFKVGNPDIGFDTIELPLGPNGKGVVVREK